MQKGVGWNSSESGQDSVSLLCSAVCSSTGILAVFEGCALHWPAYFLLLWLLGCQQSRFLIFQKPQVLFLLEMKQR